MTMRKWLRLAIVIAPLLATCSGSDDGRKAEAAGSARPEDIAVADRGVGATIASLGKLDSLIDKVVADAASLPRAEFDSAVLAADLGGDPEKLFAWVRDRTSWAPYRGLLRGPEGVLLDRLGSNLDRAVLLGDLMRRSSHTVRLAHAMLSEQQARDLLAKVRPAPSPRRSSPEAMGRSTEAEAFVLDRFNELRPTLGPLMSRGTTSDPSAVDALRDHWWVERKEKDEWVAYDVLLPQARTGDTAGVASDWSEWKAAEDLPSIPAADWHTVRISVVVERLEDGSTTESTVLDAELRPAELLKKPVILGHVPNPWPATLPGNKVDPGALRNAALWVTEWTPYLRVGDHLIAQSAFSDSGSAKALSKGAVGGLGNSTGGGLDFFGSSLGGGEASESFATAEWIDYEIRAPGIADQRLRRTVFDLLGPAVRSTKPVVFDGNSESAVLRRSEALRSQTDIFLQPCDITQDFIVNLALAAVLTRQGELRQLAKERDPARAKALASEFLGRSSISDPLLHLAAWRSLIGGGHAEDWFIDRANILNYRVGLPVLDADRIAFTELIDFASNSIGIRWGSRSNPFEVRVRQGIADTVAEMLALGSEFLGAENTASVFALQPGTGGRGEIVAARNPADVPALSWPPDQAAMVAAQIDAGFIAVAPTKWASIDGRPHIGWWRIDPDTGATIGVMDSGFNALPEKTELDATIAELEVYLEKDAAEWGVLRAGIHRSQVGRSIRWYPKELRQRDNLEQMLNILETLAGR